MDWAWFLFGFNGRITRGELWLAMLVILCWMGFLAALVAGGGKLVGGPTSFGFNICDIFAAVDPDSYRGLSQHGLLPPIIRVVGTSLFAWVFVATCVKRLHDRGKSAWWMLPFFIIPGLLNQFADRVGETPAMVAGTVMAVLHFWGFIELYCLAGNDWTNRFGPEPWPEEQVLPHAAPRRRSGWDQAGELAFAPQVASPPMKPTSPGNTRVILPKVGPPRR
jgi:uncharacterized membrane protein YhaH (DUF805 family)